MTTEPLLAVAGLAKRFGRLVVLADVSFAVPAGEVLGVVGPNGAGKSTLLDLVTGAQPADSGTVRYAGEDVTRRPAAARATAGIARTYQVPRPFSRLTVFENALVGATFGGRLSRSDAAAAALGALERTGLAAAANAPAGSLRLLDRKRLELARALAARPRLVLLDEIAGGLTEHELPALVATVAALRADGLAIVWIEHIVHALTSVADRLMCLASGTVVAIGDPAQVLASREVREVYLGSTAEEAVAEARGLVS